MSGTVTNTNCNGCTDQFGFGDIQFGTKHMTDLMKTTAEWAKPILDADRLPVQQWRLLNPRNTRGNTYGALVLGLAIPARSFEAADPTVQATLATWIKNLNTVLPGRTQYEPKDLAQAATDLRAAADCLATQSATLAQRAEITTGDAAYFTHIVSGLRSIADNFLALKDAVEKGPGICQIILDFPINQH